MFKYSSDDKNFIANAQFTRDLSGNPMSAYTVRKYTGIDDLKRMQDLVASIFDLKSDFHTGDIAWQRFQHEKEDSDWHTYLVETGGKLIAWGWVDSGSNLVLAVHPSHSEATSLLIDKFCKAEITEHLAIDIFETEELVISGLLGNGFIEQRDGPFHLRMYRNLEDLPQVKLPEGFNARYVDLEKDLEKRVNVHREVWEPSKVTQLSYRNVTSAPTYDPRLDWVIEAPDGSFASYCLIWYDRVSGLGLLEPVGTSPRFRRMGLSSAACTLALEELKKIGGTGAIVNPRGDMEPAVAAKFYESIGFRPITRTRAFVKNL